MIRYISEEPWLINLYNIHMIIEDIFLKRCLFVKKFWNTMSLRWVSAFRNHTTQFSVNNHMQCVKQLKRASYPGKSKRMCQFDVILMHTFLLFVCISLFYSAFGMRRIRKVSIQRNVITYTTILCSTRLMDTYLFINDHC